MARYYSGTNQPMGTWNNIPIYLTTIITAVFVTGLLGSVVLMHSPLLGLFIFTMPLEPSWTVWRLFSYVFVGQVSFFTPFSILFFYWMSVGLETHLGRVALSRLLVLLALVVPAVAAVWWWGLGVPSSTLGDNGYMFLSGLLVAFATLYPNSEAWGWIPFKWVAFACIVCGSLMLLADRLWIGATELWVSCGVGFAYIRYAKEQEYDDSIPLFSRLKGLFQSKPKLRVMPSPRSRYQAPADDAGSEIDPLLDKIAKSGMASLTAKERAQLERAREALMRKDQR